jgi:hypothetical protein
MQDLNRARERNQADWEARQARKDFMGYPGHTTGEYYEGQAYNWTNFEGQNPRYPSENMRGVSSYELEQIAADWGLTLIQRIGYFYLVLIPGSGVPAEVNYEAWEVGSWVGGFSSLFHHEPRVPRL